jgi:hypothetical protein
MLEDREQMSGNTEVRWVRVRAEVEVEHRCLLVRR